MASNTNFSAQSTQGKRTSFGGYPGSNASLLLEKAKAGIRRSTPDSEALASSDDEQDQHHQLYSMTPQSGPRGTRRSSWLNEFQQATQRKASLSGSGTFSPASSHPTTPIADQSSWLPSSASTMATSTGRVHSNSTSFPWGSTIWNNDNQKGPPSRLTEVLPSPTTANSPASAAFYGDDPLLSPPMNRDNVAESAIPFAIPLHPTPKTYRSQSYSVGQLDPESTGAFPSGTYPHASGRGRAGSSYTGLQHRPSRPSMLGDFSHDTSTLGQLREVEDDDDESSNASGAGVRLTDAQARTIEQLAMENALLRQAAASHQQTPAPSDAIARSSAAHLLGARLGARIGQHQLDHRKTGDREYARVEVGSLNSGQAFDHVDTAGRRLGEFYANPENQYPTAGTLENRKLESVKKGHWQSSLGFGGPAEAPQSRRHSFADVPTRHGSISSSGELQGGINGARSGNVLLDETRNLNGYGGEVAHLSQGDNGEYTHFRLRHNLEEAALELEHLHNRTFAASYFSSMDPSLRSPDLYRSSNSSSVFQQAYSIQNQYKRPGQVGLPQPHPGQLLCMVTFKACRAEVYYIQEGTGLQVKTGDLVIVEADRGTDLGTVAYHNITWAMAKELKEGFVEEHYKWLMMFSRHGQNGHTAAVNTNGSTSSMTGPIPSAVGGMGPAGQFPVQDLQNVELKPKMIKRVAQPHEVQTLRDKEANEAKAKRVCQQKVVEHRLNMEILDAEFQMSG